MKLVSDWRRAWRWWSVRALAILAALPPVWVVLPPELKATVPTAWLPWILVAVAIGGIIGRVKDQS